MLTLLTSFLLISRYDNLSREIRAHNKSKVLAHQLLELERMRNQALYTY